MGIKSRTFDIPNHLSTHNSDDDDDDDDDGDSTILNGDASTGLLRGKAQHAKDVRMKSYRVKLTDPERKRVEELIRNAKTLQEISRLEKELNEGRIPS